MSRDVGLTTALSIGVGTMIATGIFTLSGRHCAQRQLSGCGGVLLAAFNERSAHYALQPSA